MQELAVLLILTKRSNLTLDFSTAENIDKGCLIDLKERQTVLTAWLLRKTAEFSEY